MAATLRSAVALVLSVQLVASLRQDHDIQEMQLETRAAALEDVVEGTIQELVAGRTRAQTTRQPATRSPTASPTPACDTSGGATSTAGKTCNDYRQQIENGDHTLESVCNYYDDEVDDSDFTFQQMCCICPEPTTTTDNNNDGRPTPAPTRTIITRPPTVSPTPAPTTCTPNSRAQSSTNKSCSDYAQLLADGDKTVESFCTYYDEQDVDDTDFTFQAMCCLCPTPSPTPVNNDGTTTTFSPPPGCDDTSGGAMSATNKTCGDYLQDLQNGALSLDTFCSYYDDNYEEARKRGPIDDTDFTLQDMCCICPTPAPTTTTRGRTTTTRPNNDGSTTTRAPPSALGDPHVTNANQQHFDINHPGSFTLARIPREGPALLEINGTIESRNHICNHFFTSAQVGGKWVGDVIIIRALTNFSWLAEGERWPFGIQTARGSQWRALADFPSGADSQLESFEREGFQVSLLARHSKVKRNLKLNRVRITDQPSEGFFELALRNATAGTKKAAHLRFTTKLFWINIELHNLLALGHGDVAGILGTDSPDPELAEPSGKCLDWLRKRTSPKLSFMQTQQWLTQAPPADGAGAATESDSAEELAGADLHTAEGFESHHWDELLALFEEGQEARSFARATL